jgi:hypothetical protein
LRAAARARAYAGRISCAAITPTTTTATFGSHFFNIAFIFPFLLLFSGPVAPCSRKPIGIYENNYSMEKRVSDCKAVFFEAQKSNPLKFKGLQSKKNDFRFGI